MRCNNLLLGALLYLELLSKHLLYLELLFITGFEVNKVMSLLWADSYYNAYNINLEIDISLLSNGNHIAYVK